MNLKKLVVGFPLWLLVALLVGTIVFAASMLYSNTVTEHVNPYTVSLASSNLYPNQYENITFTATLKNNGLGYAGALVHFYRDTTEIGSSITDMNGNAVYVWNMTLAGDVNFKAGYQLP
jgi:uncharacterized membrane protein YbhN (UPF0104 family)